MVGRVFPRHTLQLEERPSGACLTALLGEVEYLASAANDADAGGAQTEQGQDAKRLRARLAAYPAATTLPPILACFEPREVKLLKHGIHAGAQKHARPSDADRPISRGDPVTKSPTNLKKIAQG